MIKAKGLGRGLDALLGSSEQPRESMGVLPVNKIRPGKYQPRSRMDQQSLQELAASIKVQGLMQPLLVRQVETDQYELIAGERRWRAAQLAGLESVPALVREVTNEAALAMALIENIQREDLSPMEEAAGLQRLIDEFNMTHQQAADAVGRSRSAASNLLRLLNLVRPVQQLVMDGRLEMGHARALLPLAGAQQVEIANQIIARALSVRDAESLVQRQLRAPSMQRRSGRNRDLARLEEDVSEKLGTTVEIKAGKRGSGKILVHYASLAHLEDILRRLQRGD